MPEPASVESLIDQAVADRGPVVLLTGAGISAESGIPTFRGADGYWEVGGVNYHPQEMATWEAFSRMPEEVWAWYLYRRGVCLAARPNPAHEAIAELERMLGDRFVLITQNVDGLHPRAGNTPERTYQIHGNIQLMRCAEECTSRLSPIPEAIDRTWAKGHPISEVEVELLRCDRCGGRSRPHVLWFDECYDEEHFRFESSIRAAASAAMLIVVGTAGQTNLPLQVGALVARRGAPMIVINPEPSPFTRFAEQNPRGLFLCGTAVRELPPLLERIGTRHTRAADAT